MLVQCWSSSQRSRPSASRVPESAERSGASFVAEVEEGAGLAVEVVPCAELNDGGPPAQAAFSRKSSLGACASTPYQRYFPDGAEGTNFSTCIGCMVELCAAASDSRQRQTGTNCSKTG